MLNKFKSYITKNKLFVDTDKLLLAVSGGADSVVLMDLCVRCNFNVAVAHCNFQLRGKDADDDQAFVKQLAQQYNVKSHFIRFDTNAYAKQNKLSIEMAARELRYNWFEQLQKECGYKYIATGHHLNDSIETLFLNLLRGTGYNGLRGISNKRENIIRPLLFASREDIENYVNDHKLKYCTDITNQSDEFVRNKIRNKIIPIFKEINPAFERVMLGNLARFNDASEVLDGYFSNYCKTNLSDKKNIEIPFSKIRKPIAIHLFELLNPFGFSADTITKVAGSVQTTKQSGILFFSPTHKLLIDRQQIIINELSYETIKTITIKTINDLNNLPNFTAEIIDIDKFNLIKSKNVACLDADKVSFPLSVRQWQQGDCFYPLGMTNKKKVSDFLINNKINRFDKENTKVLLNNEKQIIWLINNRIDNRFKVTSNTKQVLIIKC